MTPGTFTFSNNDTYGHEAGNTALRAIAWAFREAFRQTDVVARYGGDEFAALLPGVGREEAQAVAERLLKNIASAALPQGCLTVSVGLATYPSDTEDLQNLVQLSDAAMYRAKQEGRNKVRTCSGLE
ncbi:MAG: GGDEF domain-containing protein [Desulfotomaculales bacterium]